LKLLKTFYALILMLLSLRIFNSEKYFKNKRIAIVGAADSVFDEKNGDFIDSYDIVIRINKAAQVWEEEKRDYLGSKFTYLFHSFYENNYSGGGEVNFKRFEHMGIQKLINPNYTRKGLKTHLNFYKRHLKLRRTYILVPKISKLIRKELGGYTPTVGFSALMALLLSDFEEIYITGFTFFKTPYADGYRKELSDVEENKKHLDKQGIHNPNLEFLVFKNLLNNKLRKRVVLDTKLRHIIASE